jgi:hypothetical protein
MMNTNKQSNIWDGQPLDSITGIYNALAHLTLPKPMTGIMESIALGSEKNKFKKAIFECLEIGGIKAKIETKRYLFGLVNSISTITIQTVNTLLGYKNLPLDVFIQVGIDNGGSFYSAVKAATSPSDEKHASSITTVYQMILQASEKLGIDIEFDAPPTLNNEQSAKSPSKLEGKRSPSPAKPCNSQSDSEEPMQICSDEDEKKSDYLSSHAYGAKAALCFNASKSTNGHFAVIVDAAQSVGERKYDWTNAIKIQLGYKELPMLYAVLVGWRKSAKFDAHGAANDKSFEIERQDGENGKDGKFFVKVNAKGATMRAVPIGPMDAYPIMLVVLRQIIQDAPDEFRNKPEILIAMMKAAQKIGTA